MGDKVKISIIILILISIALYGCSNKDYDTFRNDFIKTYLEVAESVDIRNTLDTLKELQSDKNIKNIDNLGEALENIKDKVPKSKKKDYERLNEWYQGLVLLKDAYGKWDKLSSEEKGLVLSELMQIDLKKSDLEKQK
jgi:hypothetical protein